MLLFVSILFLAVALGLALGGSLLVLLWAFTNTEEEAAAQPLVRITNYRFQDRWIWDTFQRWARSKPERLVHYKTK